MKSPTRIALLALSGIFLFCAGSPVRGQGSGSGSGSVTYPRPANGIITDRAPSPATITLTPTGSRGELLPYDGWPQTQSATPDHPAVFNVPTTLFDNVGDAYHVTDVRQQIQILGSHTGEISDLSIESVFYDSTTSQYSLGNIFGTLADKVGLYNEVQIPDLFADTNMDGRLDTGDVLYAVVDLNQYLTAIPTVAFGDTYTVQDGTVNGLPGMMFSTTPFTFDPTTGFTGTPYSGSAVDEAIHGASAVPEPSTFVLAAISGALLIGYGWPRRVNLKREKKPGPRALRGSATSEGTAGHAP